MQTDTVTLKAQYDSYDIMVPPGEYLGFFWFRKGKYTFTQDLFVKSCGLFVMRNEQGMAMFRAPLKYVATGDPSYRYNNFNRHSVGVGPGWKIELKFMEGSTGMPAAGQPDRDEEGKPAKYLKWKDFPGEMEVGFCFVEKQHGTD